MHLYNNFFVGFISVNYLMFKTLLPLNCACAVLPKVLVCILIKYSTLIFDITAVTNTQTEVYGMKLQLVKIAMRPWSNYLTYLNLNFSFLHEMIPTF